MNLLDKLSKIWGGIDYPFLIHRDKELKFFDVVSQSHADLSEVRKGDVVAIIGDFNPASILTLLKLIDIGTVVVPTVLVEPEKTEEATVEGEAPAEGAEANESATEGKDKATGSTDEKGKSAKSTDEKAKAATSDKNKPENKENKKK